MQSILLYASVPASASDSASVFVLVLPQSLYILWFAIILSLGLCVSSLAGSSSASLLCCLYNYPCLCLRLGLSLSLSLSLYTCVRTCRSTALAVPSHMTQMGARARVAAKPSFDHISARRTHVILSRTVQDLVFIFKVGSIPCQPTSLRWGRSNPKRRIELHTSA